MEYNSYGYGEVEDEELERIKRKKLLELQRRLAEEEERRRQQELIEAQKRAILRRILTAEALERLSNIRLVNPQLAEFVENQLIQLAQAGRIPTPVTDEMLKKILEQIYRYTRKEYRIRFK